MAVQLEILDVNLKTRINVPANATCSGSCGKEKDVFLLAWNKDKNNLEFDFTKSNTSKFELDSVYVNLTVVSNGTETYQLVHSKPEFATPLANSYKCKKIQTLNLTEVNSNKTIAYLHMSNVQFQAFSNNSGQAFASAMDCESSITTDIVPIVVGCVLATLVVMILIAYLIGRRRCQAHGYNSM
ncbi:hypothetical protein JTB14_025299 [Gonioctena quinquepunctata]|nr:hypothetical protein JTB14_025299 [Gonioctena quinquepunctata]